jgi:hypothetical protein
MFNGDWPRWRSSEGWKLLKSASAEKRSALPVPARDRKRLSQRLALRQAIESPALKRKLAVQRRAIQKTPHPGTWRHFVASRAAHRDARAIRLLRRRDRERGRSDEEREL